MVDSEAELSRVGAIRGNVSQLGPGSASYVDGNLAVMAAHLREGNRERDEALVRVQGMGHRPAA